MWQTVVIWIIVALCAFFIGRRYLRQWRAALQKSDKGACVESSCGCCSLSGTCSSVHEIKSTRSTHK